MEETPTLIIQQLQMTYINAPFTTFVAQQMPYLSEAANMHASDLNASILSYNSQILDPAERFKNEAILKLMKGTDFIARLPPLYSRIPVEEYVDDLLESGACIMDSRLSQSSSQNPKFVLGFRRNIDYYDPSSNDSYSVDFYRFGVPGPRIKDILEAECYIVDGFYDTAIYSDSPDKMFYRLDWPDIIFPKRRFDAGHAMTKGQLAVEAATWIHDFVFKTYPSVVPANHLYNVSPFGLKSVDYNSLRLFSIEKHQDTWIPVIGLEVPLDPRRV